MKEDPVFLERVTQAVDERLSGKRLDHVHSVSEYAAELARIYGVNEYDARVAGILHDWDKLLTDDELPARMDELGLERPEQIELLYPVLHSFTGAHAVKREFPELSDEIVSAIYNHTLGSLDMSDLDIVIFVADMIEPLRKSKGRPDVKKLRKMVGKASLEELYFAAYAATIRSLLERRRFIHPLALEVWNGLVGRHHPIDVTRQGNANAVL